ncbi:MAG: hypothetical protein GC192_14275 [Bacteroidetes bacterium]|nr:hypothetical protein [Bacteroidota bacterium]
MDGNLQKQIFKPSACVSQEELRQYLSGGMNREELRRVEDHLLDCPLCSDAVDGFETAGEHATDDVEDFESFRKKLPLESSAKLRRLEHVGYWRQIVAVAAMLVVGAVAYFNFFKSPTGPQLYAKYYETYKNDIPVTLRRPGLSDVDPNFAQALSAYTDHKFGQANMLFERALQMQPDNEAAKFYAGLSLLESNNVKKASEYLNTVANSSGVYAKKAAWYLIMCDLKLDNKTQAKERLDKFLESGDIMKVEAKSLRDKL